MKKLHMLKSATDTIITSFIYEEDGVVLVFDGGFESEADTLYAKIKELGGEVNGWFLTHAHADHFGAFCEVMRKYGDHITVEKVIFNFPPLDILLAIGPYDVENSKRLIPLFYQTVEKYGIEAITPHRGDVYTFGDAAVRVLREYDPNMQIDINNTTTVYRLDTCGKRIMFLGDLGAEGGRQLLSLTPTEDLRSDYCQMSHHGQDGVERDVYEAIRPRCCLWPTPSWVWDNLGPNGYDSGGLKTIIVRGWMSELGVRKHLIDKNGPHVIDLEI